MPWCAELAVRIRRHAALDSIIPASHVAIQCTCFEKSVATNWLVPTHQDLSIPVAGRVPDGRLKGWSEKEGTTYVQPPLEVLQQLVAVRLHVDRCGERDGAFRVVPGSHLLGHFLFGPAELPFGLQWRFVI